MANRPLTDISQINMSIMLSTGPRVRQALGRTMSPRLVAVANDGNVNLGAGRLAVLAFPRDAQSVQNQSVLNCQAIGI